MPRPGKRTPTRLGSPTRTHQWASVRCCSFGRACLRPFLVPRWPTPTAPTDYGASCAPATVPCGTNPRTQACSSEADADCDRARRQGNLQCAARNTQPPKSRPPARLPAQRTRSVLLRLHAHPTRPHRVRRVVAAVLSIPVLAQVYIGTANQRLSSARPHILVVSLLVASAALSQLAEGAAVATTALSYP